MNIVVVCMIEGMAEQAEQLCEVPIPERFIKPIGEYPFLNHGAFLGIWEFDTETRTWERCAVSDGDPHEPHIAFAPGTPLAEQDVITSVMHLGVILDPPSPPEDLSVMFTAEPFRWRDWRVAWRFFPDLRRWELVPLEPI